MSFERDYNWQLPYLPAVRAIVGPMLLVPAPMERDMREACDLVVLKARDMTIGVRIRREGFAEKYPNQFTIRSHRASGSKTELSKIIEGWGDWLFYGHAFGPSSVSPWMVIDLGLLRAQFIRKPDLLHKPDGKASGATENFDNRTSFRWFDVMKMGGNVLVGRQASAMQAAA